MDNNETGLADWTVNLEQPAGMAIMSANTTMDGKFVSLICPQESTLSPKFLRWAGQSCPRLTASSQRILPI